MKLLYCFLILLPLCTYSQNSLHEISNKKLTRAALNKPELLAKHLTEKEKTDRDKVRAIFLWITDNIAYNVKPGRYVRQEPSINDVLDDPEDSSPLKSLSERVAEDVLIKRVAFCDGYARLFKTLCDYAGIRSEVVTGFANGGMGRRRFRFSSNHRWNAVYFDSTWHLVDATWASGYVTFNTDEYIKHFNNQYFLTPPKEFIRDHYPEDLKWTLLQNPPAVSEYKLGPFKMNAYTTKRIQKYWPEKGIIEAKVGDTLTFELYTDYGEKPTTLIDATIIDSFTLQQALMPDSSKLLFYKEGSLYTYRYIVPSTHIEWITLVFDEEMIMRYKLNVLKKESDLEVAASN